MYNIQKSFIIFLMHIFEFFEIRVILLKSNVLFFAHFALTPFF